MLITLSSSLPFNSCYDAEGLTIYISFLFGTWVVSAAGCLQESCVHDRLSYNVNEYISCWRETWGQTGHVG